MESELRKFLQEKSVKLGILMRSFEFASSLDENDELRSFRDKFIFPKRWPDKIDNNADEADVIYLCAHSLGLKPKKCDGYVQKVLKSWEERAIECHYSGFLNAGRCEVYPRDMMANMIGAKSSEVIIMNSLTVNLHVLLAAFYKPTKSRHKIIIEQNCFPSDNYAVKSVLKTRGFSPENDLIRLKPRQGEYCLDYDEILSTIAKEGDEVALILLPGVQYFTGQVLNMESIVKAGHEKGCIVGFDLAHAVGNTELHLHQWGVDFAVWCTYKYLSSGPGGIGGAYVHEKHTDPGSSITYLQGWWGNKDSTKFDMNEEFEPAEGASRFQLSNQPPLTVAVLMSSLEIFTEATMEKMLKKQKLMQCYFDVLLEKFFSSKITSVINITPSDITQRGSQISLLLKNNLHHKIYSEFTERGISCDVRGNSIIRLSFMPLYNSFCDIYKFSTILKEIFCDV